MCLGKHERLDGSSCQIVVIIHIGHIHLVTSQSHSCRPHPLVLEVRFFKIISCATST